MAWFVNRDGQTWGPISASELQKAAAEGILRTDDHVWQDGMEAWLPVFEVAALGLTPPEGDTPTSTAEADPGAASGRGGAAAPARSRGNFIARHWRGDFSLAAAYWGFGFLLTMVALAGLYVLADSQALHQLGERAIGIYAIVLALFVVMLSVWQIVGVWRSSQRHLQAGGRRNRAGLARAAVSLGALQLAIGSYSVLAPIAKESLDPATGEPAVVAYDIRQLQGGAEIEVAGGMPFGTSIELSRFLIAVSGVKRIRLSTRGGPIAEGESVATLIRQNELATDTGIDCVGSCALAFLAGAKRYMSPTARLGFHRADLAEIIGAGGHRLTREFRALLRAHDMPARFAAKVGATAGGVWYLTADELLAAKVVDGLSDPGANRATRKQN